MPRPIKRYAFINAKLKTRLSLVLGEDFFDGLMKSQNIGEAMLLLKETSFAQVEAVYSQTGDLKMSELELMRSEINLYREIHHLVDRDLQEFVNALVMQYEVENFKNIMRLWFDRWIRNRDISTSTGYILREALLIPYDKDAVIASGEDLSLFDSLKNTPFLKIIKKNIDEIRNSQSLFSLESDLDMLFYENLIDQCRTLTDRDSSIVMRLVGVEIDLENMTRLIRFKLFYHFTPQQMQNYIISGGHRLKPDTLLNLYTSSNDSELLPALLGAGYEGVSALTNQSQTDIYKRMELMESILEEILKREVKKLLLGDPFSIGIMMSYFIIKKHDIHRLVSILNGINYGLPEDRMKSGL
ncbi:V0D/AC39 family V-type ATPase subunit [Oceanispirochaeta crateris]|nr:V-type ATPase subunit [Oceanispirochaeta crateris]